MMRKFWSVLVLVFSMLVTPASVGADMDPDEMQTLWKDPWQQIGFTPESNMELVPVPFYFSYRKDDSKLFDVPVIVQVTFYDPRMCVEVPEYLRRVSWFNPRINCSKPSTWWLMRSGKSVVDGCNNKSCYDVTAACPQELTIINGEFSPLQLVIEEVGSRTCQDTGGAITMSDPLVVGGWKIPRLRIDVLVDLRKGFPTWATGPKRAVVSLSEEQLLALIQALE